MRKGIVKILAALALVAAAAELFCRAAGVADYPLYQVDAKIGYLPKANQSGRFLHLHAWDFNAKHMGVKGWDPAHHPNLMLVGNSIVLGGLPFDESQQLAALVQDRLGGTTRVYPVATGGWENENETAYLEANPDVVAAADEFVWEVMASDFTGLAPWVGDRYFPSHYPPLASVYAVERYLLPAPAAPASAQQGADDPAALARFARLLAAWKGRGALLFYPREVDVERARAGEAWLPERPALVALAATYRLAVVDVAADPRWNGTLYRDGIHPNGGGNALLADIIASAMKPSP